MNVLVAYSSSDPGPRNAGPPITEIGGVIGGFPMRRISLAVAALCSFLAAAPSQAGVCNIDVNPAATLLLPYFEVDLDSTDGSGANTIFSVSSATDQAVLAHVTLWSDLSV